MWKIMSVLMVVYLMVTGTLAKKKTSQVNEVVPPFLKGMPWQGKKMKHGYLRWSKRKPFTPLFDPDASKRGEKIYIKNCLECHGAKGLGHGPTAKKRGFKAANLKKVSRDLSNHYLAFQVEAGAGAMPSWFDVLTEDEIWDLTHYLHDLAMKD